MTRIVLFVSDFCHPFCEFLKTQQNMNNTIPFMKQNRIYKEIIEIEHIKSTMYSTHEAEQNSQKNK